MALVSTLCSALLLAAAWALPDHFDVPEDDVDLFRFVSRPDLAPPKINISTFVPERTTPGYIFVAPYDDLRQRAPSTLWHPRQIGPTIYDETGEVIWSGARLFVNRASFDFKVSTVNGEDHLTFVVNEDAIDPLPAGAEGTIPGGAGIILDSHYRQVNTITNNRGRGTANMHEFSVIDNGKSALLITFSSTFHNTMEDLGLRDFRWVGNNGFIEMDLAANRPVFEWWALDHVNTSETFAGKPPSQSTYATPWDFFHANSVEKDTNGDYILSARFTNCIYKISGEDGSIMWRLGGRKSSFILNGFNFSSQHDARQISANDTHTVLSLFNNASNGWRKTSKVSSAFIVVLDMTTMIATLINQFDRPESSLTELRGNVQTLSSGNTLVCWSENGRISEFTSQGELVYDSSFASHRFVTYRGFKFNFTGVPIDPPDLTAIAYGTSPETSTTVLYASWNGATEVIRWRYYGGSAPDDGGTFTPLATVDKIGFETIHMVVGLMEYVFVEAIGSDDMVLGKSEVLKTRVFFRISDQQRKPPTNLKERPDATSIQLPSGSVVSKSSALPSQLHRGDDIVKVGAQSPHTKYKSLDIDDGSKSIDEQGQSDTHPDSARDRQAGWKTFAAKFVHEHEGTPGSSAHNLLIIVFFVAATYGVLGYIRRRL